MIEALFSNNNYVASKAMLDVTQLRHEALAANIANVETPGYKRVDVSKDFTKEFSARFHEGNVQQSPAATLTEDTDATSKRRDGNSVELDKELLAMSGNSLQYDALTDFVSGSLKQLKIAITGRTV